MRRPQRAHPAATVADFLTAVLTIPAEFEAAAHFQQTCSPEAQELYARIWTDLTK